MSGEHGGAGISPGAFQEIIRERTSKKRENAQKRRLHDLRRIQEMRSSVGRDILEIFPKEIWDLIMRELGPEDRGKMWEMHELFRDLMKNSRIQNILMPQILKFEVPRFWKVPNTLDRVLRRAFRVRDMEVVVVPLANYLDLRRVSTFLMIGIDQCIEDDLLNYIHLENFNRGPLRKATEFDFNIFSRNMSKLDRALDFFKSDLNSLPRLISRSIGISIGMPSRVDDVQEFKQLLQQFCSKITCLFQLVGEQLLHFSLEIICMSTEDANAENKLRLPFGEWFSNLRNLKSFQFQLTSTKSFGSIFDIDDLQSQNLFMSEYLENLDLRFLFMETRHEIPNQDDVDAICRAFIKANPHIRTLRFQGDGRTAGSSEQLDRLENFKSYCNNVGKSNTFFEMKRMLNPNWALKILHVAIDLKYDSVIPTFQLLQNYPTLEKLWLDLSNVTIGNDIDFLRLPQLTEFRLDIKAAKVFYREPIHFFFSLQFLLHSKCLKKLWWSYQSRTAGKLKQLLTTSMQTESMIQFGAGMHDLTHSNIWKVFPYLEYVEVSTKDNLDENVKPNVREYRRKELPPRQIPPALDAE